MKNIKGTKRKVIILSDEDFEWDEQKIIKFRELWDNNVDFLEICRELKSKPLRVGLLLLDQAEEGHIKKRAMGLGVKGYLF